MIEAGRARNEWIETDGLGGFTSGTVGGVRTRRYHALLLSATRPPAGRVVLAGGYEAWVETAAGRFALSSQRYAPGVTHPDGERRIESFSRDPWPQWRFRLEDGTRIEQQIVVRHGEPTVAIVWKLIGSAAGPVRLSVRPLLSGRDYHAMHHENPQFRFEPLQEGERIVWRPYEGLPSILSRANARYEHAPEWYRNFLYEEERGRGLDDREDLASPGVLHWDLAAGEAIWILTAAADGDRPASPAASPKQAWRRMRAAEAARRRGFATPIDRAADAYLVQRGAGRTVVAGYPWFTDWGRDTFIALRGLCLATGRLDDARRILLEWTGHVSEGMLPNRFPDRGENPEYNSVDASLWFVIAVHEFLQATDGRPAACRPGERRRLERAIEAILSGYAAGTRYGIRMDDDGLLAAGVPGVQLTWMDAKVGDWVVTPRVGKPVEVQALWLNALRIAGRFAERWSEVFDRGRNALEARFWNPESGSLHDVVDVDHRAGSVDPTIRPNQILVIGGLPFPLIDGKRARMIVERVERDLLTPIGLRSLAPGETGFVPRYEGGVLERDGAYHQGTVWPWLIGPFVEAWLRVRGATRAARGEARRRFLPPLFEQLESAGLGHLSEIADAEPPHTPRGCPFQAWSVGELLRLDRMVLADRPGR